MTYSAWTRCGQSPPMTVVCVYYLYNKERLTIERWLFFVTNDIANADIIKMYTETWDEMKKLIEETKTKAQKAMRVTLWLKIIVSIASISAIASWLKDHGHKEIWALILIFSEIADMLLDNLPYFNQRINLPQQKLKMEHIEVELKNDLIQFERGDIAEDEALRRYFAHRKAWLKVAG